MGVIDNLRPNRFEVDDDGNYVFSAKPSTPRDQKGDILIKFQAVSRTQQCFAKQFISFSPQTSLFRVRRRINKYFKSQYERGFIFLSKTKEILKSEEKELTLFDILPKVPQIGSRKLPNEKFLFEDVHYTPIIHSYDGERYRVMCACIVFLFERSTVSHWSAENLRHELSANALEGFSFIPSDILSWSQRLINSRIISVHIQAAARQPTGTSSSHKEKQNTKDSKRTDQGITSQTMTLDTYDFRGAQVAMEKSKTHNLKVNIEELQKVIRQTPAHTKICDLCDHRGATPLHYAASNGNLAYCEFIIAALGKDLLYVTDVNGKSPLHCAFYKCCNNLDTVVYLLQQNSDLFLIDKFGTCPLGILWTLDNQTLEYLANKIDFECVSANLQYFFLQFTMKRKDEALSINISKHIKNDVQENLELDWLEWLGESLLHLSAPLDVSITKQIIHQSNAKLDLRDITHRLPFHVACKSGSFEQVKLLFDSAMEDDDIRKGIKIALQSKRYSVLPYIQECRPDMPMDEETVCYVREILNSKLKKCQQSKDSNDKFKEWEETAKHLLPLLCADDDSIAVYVFDSVYYGLVSTLDFLGSLGVQMDICDQLGRTPLHEASQRNTMKCLKCLLKQKVSLNSTDQRGSTALHYACEKGHIDSVKCLIGAGALGSLQDVCGRTPLMLSIYRKRLNVATYLISNHATRVGLDLTDKAGYSIMHYAPFLPDETLDILLSELKTMKNNSKQHQSAITESQRAHQLKNLAWIWNVQNTSYKAKYPGHMCDKENWKIHNESSKNFHGTHEHTLWKDCKQTEIIRNDREKSSPLKSYEVCAYCNKVRLLKHHICRDSLGKKDLPSSSKSMTFRAFECHNLKTSANLTPLFIALRCRNYAAFKKLSKLKPRLLDVSDNLGRNVVQFSIEQGSLKLVQQTFDNNARNDGLIHDLLLRHKLSPMKNDVDILSHLLSGDGNLNYIPEPDQLTHGRCGLHFCKWNACTNSNCHLRSYTSLEIAALLGNNDLFKEILNKCQMNNLGISLHMVSYYGNASMINNFHKRRLAFLQDIGEDMMNLDSLYAFNLACCSPYIDREAMSALLKHHPIALKAENCVNVRELEEIRPHFRTDMSISDIAEMTPLGKVLSPKHPCKKAKRKQQDEIGCWLVDSKLNLGLYKYDDGEKHLNVHGACEALLVALQSEHFNSVLSIIESAGFVVWNCALTKHRCDIQKSFQRRIHNVKDVNYIKYIIYLLTQRQVPEKLLQSFIRVGEVFLKDTDNTVEEISLNEVRDELLEELSSLHSPIGRICLCVLEIIRIRRSTADSLKLLKCSPLLYPFYRKFDMSLIDRTVITDPAKDILKIFVRFLNIEYGNDYVRQRHDMTILHVACCTDKLDIIKMILEAPLNVNIKTKVANKLRAIDIAAAYGHWHIVNYLLEMGASFTSRTLFACCATSKYMDIHSWGKHFQFITDSELASDKSRAKIFKTLCKMQDIDVDYSCEGHGSILYNAIKNGLNDIVEYILERKPFILIKTLNEEPDVSEYIPMCHVKTLDRLSSIIHRNIASINARSVRLLLIQLAKLSKGDSVTPLVSAMDRALSEETWMEILLEKDREKKADTPLHAAVINGHRQACDIFVKHMVEFNIEKAKLILNQPDSTGRQALWYAFAFGYWEVAKLLLLAGACPLMKRAIPGFRTRRVIERPKKQKCITDRDRGIYEELAMLKRKPFPSVKNSSKGVASCINPMMIQFNESHINTQEHTALSPALPKVSPTKKPIWNMSNGDINMKKDAMHIFDMAVIAYNYGTSLQHLACSKGDGYLLENLKKLSIKEECSREKSHFTPLMYSLLSLKMDFHEQYATQNTDQSYFSKDLLRALLWKTSKSKSFQKSIEISIFRFIEVLLKKANVSNYELLKLKEFFTTRCRNFLPVLTEEEFQTQLQDFFKTESNGSCVLAADDRRILQNIHMFLRSTREMEKFSSMTFNLDHDESTASTEYLTRICTTLLENAESQIDNEDVFLMILIGLPWCLTSLLRAAKQNRSLNEILRSKIFGTFTFLDCVVATLPKNLTNHDNDYVSVVKEIVETYRICLDDTIAITAVENRHWDILIPIIILSSNIEGKLTPSWQQGIAIASSQGHLQFLKTVLDINPLTTLSADEKICFGAHVCLAALHGKSDIVKYLLRSGVSVSTEKENVIFKNIMGKHYQKSWTILEYAIKGNNSETVELVLKFYRFDKEIMRNLNWESLLQLATIVGNTSIMILIVKTLNEEKFSLTSFNWNANLLEAAKRGHESMCIYIIKNFEVDITFADKRNTNLCHYCALRNMASLLTKVSPVDISVLKAKDLDGFMPYEYALAVGNHKVALQLSATAECVTDKLFSHLFVVHGWLRYLLETNENKADGEIAEILRENNDHIKTEGLKHLYTDKKCGRISKHVLDRALSIENIIKYYDDKTCAMIIKLSSKVLQPILAERPNEYKHLLHLASRHGRPDTIEAVLRCISEDMSNTPILRQFLLNEKDGMIPLAVATKHSQKECIKLLASVNDAVDWVSTRTGENILHIAVKTSKRDTLELVLQYSNSKLLRLNDGNNTTPMVAALALGNHDMTPMLYNLDNELNIQCRHDVEEIEYDCEACLFDEAIGWSKFYLSESTDIPDFFPRNLDDLQEKPCLALERAVAITGINSSLVVATMIVMGYQPTIQNIVLRLTMQPPHRSSNFSNYLLSIIELYKEKKDLPEKVYDPVTILGTAIQYDRVNTFSQYLPQIPELEEEFEARYKVTVYEAVIGMGGYKCLEKYEEAFHSEKHSVDVLIDIKDTIPITSKWLAGIEIPGDEEWIRRISCYSESDTSARLSSTEIWLVSTIPETKKRKMESMYAIAKWVPEEINQKKFSPDFESFKKHRLMSGKSEPQIKCIIGSGAISGFMYDVSCVEDSKIQAVSGIKITCIQPGTNEQAKTFIDGSRTLCGAIELIKDNGAIYAKCDKSLTQRPKENILRNEIQRKIIPKYEDWFAATFDMNTHIIVDWSSIETRKRTCNAETVLKCLTGEIFNNPLGGLADVLNECRDMKCDIEGMFTPETVKLAVGSASSLSEITVSFGDKLPVIGELQQQTSQLGKDSFTWYFALEHSRLLYNRETFPLWRQLHMYRAMCVSLCSAVHSLSIIDSDKIFSDPESDRNSNLTLDIDWRSFGVKDLQSVHKLITQPLAREVQGISYDCLGLLRLHQAVTRVQVKSSPSHQHTGITFQDDTAVIAIYPEMNDKNEWIVARTNADKTLAEIEDKQLLYEWDPSLLNDITRNLKNVEKEIRVETGFSTHIQIDEKKILLSTFRSIRREMNHPNKLIKYAVEHAVNGIAEVYSSFMENLLDLPFSSTCRNLCDNLHDTGAWVKDKGGSRLKENVLFKKTKYTLDLDIQQFEAARNLTLWKGNMSNYLILPSQKAEQKQQMDKNEKCVGPFQFHLFCDIEDEMQYISFKNKLYEVQSEDKIQMRTGKMSQKVLIAHDVSEIMEYSGREVLKKLIVPSVQSKTQPLQELFGIAMYMKNTTITQLNDIFPVDIDINVRSFIGEATDLKHFSLCMKAVVDTAHSIVRPDTCCYATSRTNRTIYHLLSSIYGITLMLEDERDEQSTKSDTYISCSKSSGLSKIYLTPDNHIVVAFSKQRIPSTFKSDFQRVLVLFSEKLLSDILSLSSVPSRKLSNSSTSTRRHFIDIRHLGKPSFDVVIDIFPQMCDIFSELMKTIPSLPTIISDQISKLCFSEVDGDRATISKRGDALVIQVPSSNPSLEGIASSLLKALEVPDDKMNVQIPVFRIDSPDIIFASMQGGTVVLKVNNLIDNSTPGITLDDVKLSSSLRVIISLGNNE